MSAMDRFLFEAGFVPGELGKPPYEDPEWRHPATGMIIWPTEYEKLKTAADVIKLVHAHGVCAGRVQVQDTVRKGLGLS